MSHKVERTVKGNVYQYEEESYWDKEKKQPRKRSKYLGPKEKAETKKIKKALSELVYKNYGNIFLLEEVSKSIGLFEVVKDCYPDIYKEILSLAYYEITGESKNYLFHHFQDENYLSDVKTLYSSDISDIHQQLGYGQRTQIDFFNKWIAKINPQDGIYYDITSYSSYSTNNEFVEWGYNRDRENLPQINLGMVCCNKTGLPFFYNVFQGSIVDVQTIKNFIKQLAIYSLQKILLIMDRGFFSVSNIIELTESDRNLGIIIPLPFSLKLSKELIVNNQDIKNTESMFKYNDEILYHKVVPTTIKNKKNSVDVFAHIFFNEKAEVELRHQFYFKLFTYEEKIKQNTIKDENDFEIFVNQELPDSIKKYYYFDKTDQTVKRNEEKINEYLLKLGYFIITTTEKELSNETILSYYRDKDKIEKIFDTSKNELNTNRLHSHSKPATEGRLFVKFIATIIYQQITKIMREKNMFKKYSVTDMLKELSKLKMYSMPNIDNFTTECSKNNREILKLFNLEITP